MATPIKLELLAAYKRALVEGDEEQLRALEAESPELILQRSRLREEAWREHNEAVNHRREHERDENWGEIQAEDLRRVRGEPK